MADPYPLIPEGEEKPLGWLFGRNAPPLPEDITAVECRRRALAALERTDPHYGRGGIFVETAKAYALLALSAGEGDQ